MLEVISIAAPPGICEGQLCASQWQFCWNSRRWYLLQRLAVVKGQSDFQASCCRIKFMVPQAALLLHRKSRCSQQFTSGQNLTALYSLYFWSRCSHLWLQNASNWHKKQLSSSQADRLYSTELRETSAIAGLMVQE
jgi:hypothetical protein